MTERSLATTQPRNSAQHIGLSSRGTLLLLLASVPLLLFLLVPLIALVLQVSLPQLLTNLANHEVVQALTLSVWTTLATVLLALVFGTPLAYLLARYRFPGRTVLDTLLDLPMVLPPSVAGIALLVAFGRRGLVGQALTPFGITIAFTQVAVILAQTFVAVPFYVKAAVGAFGGIDRELEQAASVDGASRWNVFYRITLPLAWSTLFSGLVMTWARALGEFGATIIFAGNFPGRTQTMPLAIYIGFEVELNVALTLALILLVISFGVLFMVKFALGQRVTLN